MSTKKAATKKSATKKVTKKAPAKKAASKKVNVEASTAAALAAQNAETSAQPGIISTLMNTLIDAKTANTPMTTDELLATMVEKFPERPAAGMMVTIRAQLSRLPVQKNFAITKVRDGRKMRYAAA